MSSIEDSIRIDFTRWIILDTVPFLRFPRKTDLRTGGSSLMYFCQTLDYQAWSLTPRSLLDLYTLQAVSWSLHCIFNRDIRFSADHHGENSLYASESLCMSLAALPVSVQKLVSIDGHAQGPRLAIRTEPKTMASDLTIDKIPVS